MDFTQEPHWVGLGVVRKAKLEKVSPLCSMTRGVAVQEDNSHTQSRNPTPIGDRRAPLCEDLAPFPRGHMGRMLTGQIGNDGRSFLGRMDRYTTFGFMGMWDIIVKQAANMRQ